MKSMRLGSIRQHSPRRHQGDFAARGALGVCLGVAVALLVLGGAVEAQTTSSDPIIGTWAINMERSVWMPGPRPPADFTDLRQFAPIDGGWVRFTQTTVNQQGNPVFSIGVYKLDGQRHPVHNINTLGTLMTTGQRTTQTRSYRVIDARTTEFTTFNDGVATLPSVRTVSPDGTSYTQITRGTNPQGVAVSSALVYDRVQ